MSMTDLFPPGGRKDGGRPELLPAINQRVQAPPSGPWFGLPSPSPETKIVTEPWMEEFVRGRHSPEEWDAFFAYCEAGPWKRRFIVLGGVIARIFRLI